VLQNQAGLERFLRLKDEFQFENIIKPVSGDAFEPGAVAAFL
jgi:hypothetical protein